VTTQNKKSKNIRQNLALATGALLAHESQAASPEEAELYSPWSVDVGYLRYEEPDYITVDTFMAMLSGNVSDKDSVKVGLVFDTLTGSTPTGAIPGGTETYTGASGGGGSSVSNGGGTVPFDDTRLAFDTSWTHEWQRLLRSSASAYVSVEGDYTAIGGSIGIEKDNKDRSTTYSAAFGMSTDTVGRSDETTPAPLSKVSDAEMFGTGSKNSYEALFGLSKILNRRTVAMLNLTYSRSLGYHTDPYKVISVADTNDVQKETRFEKRPDERERYILYTKVVHELPKSGHHIDLSYRYHFDNWEINSHTVEGGYSLVSNNNHLFKPFARLYYQPAASFYTRTISYEEGEEVIIPELASSDIRLAEMFALTTGVKYQYKLSNKTALDIRAAYINRDYTDAVVKEADSYFLTVGIGKAFN
jgi:hypothetical protein